MMKHIKSQKQLGHLLGIGANSTERWTNIVRSVFRAWCREKSTKHLRQRETLRSAVASLLAEAEPLSCYLGSRILLQVLVQAK